MLLFLLACSFTIPTCFLHSQFFLGNHLGNEDIYQYLQYKGAEKSFNEILNLKLIK